MIRSGETVFVDTGAWIALAQSRDPLHLRVMSKARIRTAFTFDHHFATAGFRVVG